MTHSRRSPGHALTILDRMVGDDAELRRMIEEETLNAQVARQIYEARTTAGLTQRDLARLIHTTQSVISRLEDGDYEGHSLSMLRRIADVLHQRLEVRLVPLSPARGTRKSSAARA